MPDYTAAIKRAALRHHIDPNIFLAQLRQESGLREGVTSRAGARDIAQFMPETAKRYGVTLGDGRAADDIEGAAHMMADLLAQNHGSYAKALSAYNSGSPDQPYPETRHYVHSILAAAGGGPRGDAAPDPHRGASPTGHHPQDTYSALSVPADTGEARQQLLLNFLRQRLSGDSRAGGVLRQGLLSLHQQSDTPVVMRSETPGGHAAGTGGTHAGAGSPMSSGRLKELFWQGHGGIDVKNGQQVPQGFVSGHQDHVHVASGPKTVVRLGRHAQKMGLHVGENPVFGAVHPVHAQNSYHYRGQAIDVSGDPALEEAFAHWVARKFGVGR